MVQEKDIKNMTPEQIAEELTRLENQINKLESEKDYFMGRIQMLCGAMRAVRASVDCALDMA